MRVQTTAYAKATFVVTEAYQSSYRIVFRFKFDLFVCAIINPHIDFEF